MFFIDNFCLVEVSFPLSSVLIFGTEFGVYDKV